MAKLEELEEEEEVKEEVKQVKGVTDDAKKLPDKDSTTRAAAQIGTSRKDEESDSEQDGFETASEGRDGDSSYEEDDDDTFSDTEQEKFDRLGLNDTHEGIASTQSSSDRVANINSKTRLDDEAETMEGRGEGDETDEQLPLTAEQQKQLRQQGIEAAMKAKAEGNSHFSQGEYEEALVAYQRGLSSCPSVLLPEKKEMDKPLGKEEGQPEEQAQVEEEAQVEDEEDVGVKEIRELRAVLHSNRAACFIYREMYTNAVEESTKALELNPNYVKALMRRAQAKEKLESYEEAIGDVKRVLELDPGNAPAKASLRTLVPLAEEKREKLKNDMIAKLKEAGNSILGRFGMSVDNFKTVQDPDTGSYSIQFQR